MLFHFISPNLKASAYRPMESWPHNPAKKTSCPSQPKARSPFFAQEWGFAPIPVPHLSQLSKSRQLPVFMEFAITTPRNSKAGNRIAVRSPACRLPHRCAAIPTAAGPAVHPRSPAKARKANIAVPPPRSSPAARLKVPGHKIPTDKPHKAHPASAHRGDRENAANP